MAGNRSHAFIRGLYANAQNQLRRSGSRHRTSHDPQPKRKRTDEENVDITPFDSPQSLFSAGAEYAPESELYSCLFDHDNRCTIFDDEPGTAMNTPVEMLPPFSMDVSSGSPTFAQINLSPTPPEMTKFTSFPVSKILIPHGKDADNKAEPALFENELFSCFFDQNNECIFLADNPRIAMNVPTMEMKRCKLSPSSPKVTSEAPALVQVNVTSTPSEKTKRTPLKVAKVSDALLGRTRPLKNVRERRRRAHMRGKFMQLYNLCCSKMVTSIIPAPSTEATGLLIPISGHGGAHTLVNNEPSKVEVLVEAIQALEAFDKELTDLKTRNRELMMKKKEQCIQ